MELVDELVDIVDDDRAVGALEAEEVAVLRGLDAVDEDQLAAALLVIYNHHVFLLREGAGEK